MSDSDTTKSLTGWPPSESDRHGLSLGQRVRVIKGEHSGLEGDIRQIEEQPLWGTWYHVAIGKLQVVRKFPWDYLGPMEAQGFTSPIRSVREEAHGLLRAMEVGNPDIIRAARERLSAALEVPE